MRINGTPFSSLKKIINPSVANVRTCNKMQNNYAFLTMRFNHKDTYASYLLKEVICIEP